MSEAILTPGLTQLHTPQTHPSFTPSPLVPFTQDPHCLTRKPNSHTHKECRADHPIPLVSSTAVAEREQQQGCTVRALRALTDMNTRTTSIPSHARPAELV